MAEELREAYALSVDYLAIERVYDSLTIHDKHEVVVNGGMLIKEYGFQPGPALGEILTKIEYAIVDGELANEKDHHCLYPASKEGGKMSDFIVEKLTNLSEIRQSFVRFPLSFTTWIGSGLIGVNGTGKTTLLDVLSGRSGFDGDVSPFSAKSDYTIGYLTQEPDFDDQRRFWIRCYLVICVKCS